MSTRAAACEFCKLICMLVVLIGVSTWLPFIVVTNLSGQMLTFDGVWHFGEVFSSQMNLWLSLYRADGRQSVWRRVCKQFADVNVVDRVVHGGGGVMVWAGVCYGQWIQVHFIDGILNAQRYRDEIMRSIVVILIHDHYRMLQYDNAWPYVARICSQFLEAENIQVLAWPAYSLDMSPIEHVWDALDRRKRQSVPVPANIQHLHSAIEEEWTNIPQATINNLINSMRRRCVAVQLMKNGGKNKSVVFIIFFSVYIQLTSVPWQFFGIPPPPQLTSNKEQNQTCLV